MNYKFECLEYFETTNKLLRSKREDFLVITRNLIISVTGNSSRHSRSKGLFNSLKIVYQEEDPHQNFTKCLLGTDSRT